MLITHMCSISSTAILVLIIKSVNRLFNITPTCGVTRKAWLSGSLLIRPLRVGPLWVGHLRVRHLRVGPGGEPRACLWEARLSVASCWCVRSPGGLAVVGRGHAEARLRGSVHAVVKRVGFAHYGVTTLVLGHGEGERLTPLLEQSGRGGQNRRTA